MIQVIMADEREVVVKMPLGDLWEIWYALFNQVKHFNEKGYPAWAKEVDALIEQIDPTLDGWYAQQEKIIK